MSLSRFIIRYHKQQGISENQSQVKLRPKSVVTEMASH